MATLQILSDIHNEFGTLDVPVSPNEKEIILILAGDIGVAKKRSTYQSFLQEMSERFLHVVYVLGNHEHYSGSVRVSLAKIQESIKELDNVHLLENQTFVHQDVAFVGATLWTDINRGNPHDILVVKDAMNDFKLIRTGNRNEPYRYKFTPSDSVALHVASKKFIFSEIVKQKEDGKKVVVVTHHLPSYFCVSDRFKGDYLNPAFASELGYDIVDADPNLWIFGHTHDSFDSTIGNTRMVCNPRGYAGHELNPDFNPTLRISV